MKYFSSKKAFTLIELLVTISIITFLMSFVMASLSSARNKAVDSSIKTGLSSMRPQASIYYDGASTYVGLCTNTAAQTVLFSAASSTGAIVRVNNFGGRGFVTCNATTTGWAIQAPLKTDVNKFFCVDSNMVPVVTAQVFVDQNDVSCGAIDAVYVPPPEPINVKVLVVGGGGGGAYSGAPGGGGGGGVQYISSFGIQTNTSYSVIVGGGGAGGNSGTNGQKGGDSIFSTITAYGGGSYTSLNGGCGAGAIPNNGGSLGGSGSQGGKGGDYIGSQIPGGGNGGGPGGGGAGSFGLNGGFGEGGNGGPGIANSITGVSILYSGGGGGGTRVINNASCCYPGNGGSGGGGMGGGWYYGSVLPVNGTDGRGGGGGGSRTDPRTDGARGGSGVVIVSYPTVAGFSHSGGNATGSDGAGNTWVSFTTPGTFKLVKQ